MAEISKLLEIMEALRTAGSGCPWDLEQTFATIAPHTIEEAYEVADAIERGALGELESELGDLLFQIVFYTQMAAERDAFTFGDVVRRISEKLVRRHPHVFGEATVADPAAQSAAWETIKREERAGRVLADIPLGLPGLSRAAKIGRRASSVGFDWSEADAVRAKVAEELAELDDARASGTHDDVEDEMGDLLFVLANLCRHLALDPEACLRRANAKFERRFARVEAAVDASGRPWQAFEQADLERFWDAAKAVERK